MEGILKEGYFSALPPKSCGREQFGEAFVSRFIAMCRKAGGQEDRDEDVVATATALTAASVVDAYRRFVWGHVGQAAPLSPVEFVVAGGGAKNDALMGMLREGLEPLGVKVRVMEELGVPAQAKEAVAFALLAWLTWNGLPGNVPAATGARRAVVLGKVTSRMMFCGRAEESGSLREYAHPMRDKTREDGAPGFVAGLMVVGCWLMVGCRGRVEEPGSVVMIIESSPNNLDLRVGDGCAVGAGGWADLRCAGEEG